MSEDFEVKKGQILSFCFSDFDETTETGHRFVKEAFNIQSLAKQYLDEKGGFDPDKTELFDFLDWLDSKGLTEKADVKRFFCGGYSNYDFNFFGLVSDEEMAKFEEYEEDEDEDDFEKDFEIDF